MWTLTWWSLGHILSIVVPLLLIVIFYFLLRKRSQRTQKVVIFILILLNVFQHLFKYYVWWPLYKNSFDWGNITFCNVCASVILLSPFTFLGKNKAFKDATFYMGIFGGIMSLWVISIQYGANTLGLDYIRYFTCHTILMMTSSLPVLLGLHTLNTKNFWKVGLCFIALEAIVFVDNVFFCALSNGFNWEAAYQTTYNNNQLFICHAATSYDLRNTPLRDFHLKYVIDDGACFYIPVLWSFPAIFPVLSLAVLFFTWICKFIKINGHHLAEGRTRELEVL